MTMMTKFIKFFIVLSRLLLCGSLETCFFPDYLQGDYLVQSSFGLQSTSSPRIQYKTVTIAPEAISPWGFCYKKLANDMYLTQSIDDKSVCLRCFHISIKSQNVIIVRTSGNPDRCSITEDSAKLNCPKTEFIDTGRQMILYKSAKDIKKEQCPINGVYKFQYKQHKLDQPLECVGLTSQVDNCPVGSEFNIRFKDCPFENNDIVLECLGTWDGPNNQRYLALFDTRPTIDDGKLYRCGLYSEDPKSGNINVAFSSDSTCLNDLKTSQSGFETLVLVPQPSNSQLQTTERASCRFPNWIQGHWELVTVNGKTLTYMDIVHYKSYTFQCLHYDETERRYEFPISIDEEKKILVHGKTHCGEELYSCIWIKRRGPNVFEFQFSTPTSSHYNASLCSLVNFQSNVWITQGRKDYLEESPCPILGKYIGTLPDTADRLCAKLSSDCTMPDTMYYTVSDCSTQIYEDREYQCLGQWQENGLTYTFTQRKHIGTYECFVGSMISETEFSIREAGRHCERNGNSMLGMILKKTQSCTVNRTSSTSTPFVPTTVTTSSPAVIVTTTRPTSPRRVQPVTRPFRPLLNVTRPQFPYRSKTSNTNASTKIVPTQLFVIFVTFVYCFY